MTIEKLQRVMWRIRKKCPDRSKITRTELKRAIMVECGTSPETYYNNKKALLALGWVKSLRGSAVRLTNKDLTGDY